MILKPILQLILTIGLVSRLVRNTPLRSPCPRAIQINTNYQYRGTLHFICLQAQQNSLPSLDVIQYNTQEVIFSREVPELGTNQLASFVDNDGTLRVIVSVSNRVNGTSVYSINSLGQYINEKHTINTQLVSSLSIWKLELNLEWQLAIANGPTYGPYLREMLEANSVPAPPPILRPMITIHSWRSTYFDKYQQIELPHEGRISKLEPMHINDQEFLVVAMEASGEEPGVPVANSLIYKLDFGEGNLDWVHYQSLGTQVALDASSFAVAHRASLQRDYYIALVGQAAPADPSFQSYGPQNGSDTSSEFGLMIYKYFGDRFILYRSIPAPAATKLDTISYGSGDSYVIVALSSGSARSVSLYSFDGLDLKPLPGPQMPGPPPPQPARGAQYPHLQRRSMEPTSALRLFIDPATLPVGADHNATNSKRTLTADEQSMRMPPALAFSAFSPDSDQDSLGLALGASMDTNSTNHTAPTNDIVYQIPINDLMNTTGSAQPLENEAPSAIDQQNLTQKRAYIPTARLPLGSELFNWCKATIEQILGDNYEQLTQQLIELPRIDQGSPIEVHGNLLIDGDLHVSNLLYAHSIGEIVNTNIIEQLIVEPVPVVSANYTQPLDQIEQTQRDIELAKQRVDQILVDDGTIQEVYTPLTFDKIVFECLNPVSSFNDRLAPPMNLLTCPQVGELRATYLNGHDVSDIQQQAHLSGRTMIIKRDVRFEHLVLLGETKILDTLNDIPIEEIVFGRGAYHTGPITGRKRLREALYSSRNLIVERWRGQLINRNSVLTSSGTQHINADLKFSQVILDGPPAQSNYSSRIEQLNGLHLDTHLEQIARTDQVNDFRIPIRFEELVLNAPIRFSPDSRLSSIDLTDLWHNTMFKSIHQNITAPMEFSGEVQVSLGGNIRVNGPINGVFLHPDNVLMRDRDYDLPNPFVFHGDVQVDGNLQLLTALNGIQVAYNNYSRQNELAILYNVGDQILTGDKIFNTINLGGQTYIDGTINGKLNLTHLYSLTNNNGQPFRFKHYRLSTDEPNPWVRFGDKASIQIDNSINGVPVQQLCSLAQNASMMQSNYYRRLRFDQPITIRSLRCASINGFNDLRNSFLTRHGTQRVLGSLRLANGVLFNSTIQIASKFNGLNVAPLARAISQAINESRTGHKEILGDFHVDDLIVDGQINDLQMRNVFIARADYPQLIRAPMTFDHLDVENVIVVGGDLLTESFNRINVSEIFTNTLQYDAPQVVYNHIDLQNLHTLPGTNVVTKVLNGYDLQRLYSDAVLIDSPQQILAPKTFRAPVHLNDRVFLRFGIDGLSEDELRFNLLIQGDELIESDVEFNEDVFIKKTLEIQTGSINDIDVGQFVGLLLYERPDKPSLRLVGNSSIRFRGVQLNNLALTGKIQGIDLSREAILRNGSQHYAQPPPPLVIQPKPVIIHQQQPQPLPPFIRKPATDQYPPQIMYTPVVQGPAQQPPQVVQHHPKIVWSPPPVIMPRPLSFINQSAIKTTWRPNWNATKHQQKPINYTPPAKKVEEIDEDYLDDLVYKYNFVNVDLNLPDQYALVDQRYLQHKARLRAEALNELSTRINKYLSISFYYEIAQKHPLLGPLLSDADNPISNEEGSPLLLLKGMSKRGEPCLQRGQTIAVMAPQRSRSLYSSQYTLSSQISETSQPVLAESLILNGKYYLFILDLHPPQLQTDSMSQVLVYTWDHGSGRYDLRDQILVDGYPTALKAFTVHGLNQSFACFALANPRVSWQIGGHMASGPLLIRCQSVQDGAEFSQQHVLPLTNVFDLDAISAPTRKHQVVLAALAQQDTEQIGDLLVYSYDFATRQTHQIDKRRLVKPLKLHFIKRPQALTSSSSGKHQLVVSEAITSNHEAQALTRIFTLDLGPQQGQKIYETQVIRDNQFGDIQSVQLDHWRALLFLKSTHSISIYAPTASPTSHEQLANCSPEFALVQKIPTKGANKFLVVNSNRQGVAAYNQSSSSGTSKQPLGHFLILSRDDCERQQYSTLILKAKFQ